jgi:hypothetical protein
MDGGPIFTQMSDEDRRRVRRSLRLGAILVAAVTLGAVLLSGVEPYTEFLWFAQDTRQPIVFTRSYGARGTLFAVAFLLTWAFVGLNLRQALKVTLVFLRSPANRQ